MCNERGIAMSLLEEFYYGNIVPNTALPDRSEEMEAKSTELEEKIKNLLSEEGKALFNQYSNHETTLSSLDLKDNFLFGFRFGALMMLEIFQQSTNLMGEK